MTTYHYYPDNITTDRRVSNYKFWKGNSSSATYRSTYDTQLSYNKQPPYSARGVPVTSQILKNLSSPLISTNDNITKDNTTNRSKVFGLRKPLHSYSSSHINVTSSTSFRTQPSYLSTNRLSYQHLLNQIAQITDSIYLSSISAITHDRIRELGITMLVSMITEAAPIRASNLENVLVPIEDNESANLRSYFDRILERIHREEVRGGKILVHCIAGVSRSSSLVIAYLMKYHAMRLRQAYNHVRARRPYIQPNIGFWKQLIEYEKRLFGTSSVRLLPNRFNNSVSPDVPPSALGAIIFNAPPRYTKVLKSIYA